MHYNKKIKVGINGYGVIGKRVADAVMLQPDMDLIGIADIATDYRIKTALRLNIPVFAAVPEKVGEMKKGGIYITGTIDDLLSMVDVIVDATPKNIGAANFERYRSAGVKAIFQGGEKHSLTGHSFVAQANYESAVGRDTTRVVSCNTTGTVRTLKPLQDAGLLKKARGVLIRRATDPWESDRGGIMNTVVPERHIPSHQGPDAQTVLPDLDVITMAAKASHTQTHLHYWIVELTKPVEREDILEIFRHTPRLVFIKSSDGLTALNSTVELMKDLGRPRGDMWEVAIWEDILSVNGTELYFSYQVFNEAIVVPENIDAIRALTGSVKDGKESMHITDENMIILKDFLIPNEL
jgi:glyceraldehyde-3-phosphate dehydrogenase (NAD(P))